MGYLRVQADYDGTASHSGSRTSVGLPSHLRIAVGIATAGRPDVARSLLDRLSRQSLQPDRVIVSVPTAADLAAGAGLGREVEVLVGTRGLTAQRNEILRVAGDMDVVCFFDDDFIPQDSYLSAIEAAFRRDPKLLGATGTVIADGIIGPGLSSEEAERYLDADRKPRSGQATPTYCAYGCNMAFRMSTLRDAGIQFDENLPAYGWLEDVDVSRRVARLGTLAHVEDARGVHLGVKGGRQSGRRFGYSQVANPLYLVVKGSFTPWRAAWLMARNICMNLIRAPYPEPHIDRTGRLAGNARAFADLVTGRLHPTRIADLV